MPESPAITSNELGTLWMTYQQKTMLLRMLDYFIEKADDEKAKNIMTGLCEEVNPYVQKIVQIFKDEGAAIPVGFTEQDVIPDAPKLYSNGFDIMFVRLMNSISMGLHTLHLSMSYREDIILLYKDLTAHTQDYSRQCTQYLLEKGLLSRAPYVTMPKKAEFVKDTSYLKGTSPFGQKRTMNTVEVSQLHYSIDANATGMQLITGFAQCAQEKEVRKYFSEGAELAKSIIKEFSEMMLEDGIQTPLGAGGNATRSTAAPFSDKLMMYCTSLFCSFSLGKNAIGTAFSLRNDIPTKAGIFSKDIFEYAHRGAKIMIQNGWMEEPPQMEERRNLI
ncbi:DUF3231 family protein [Bacillus sp. ISL-47]|uniref:DUF3231 family protein n=1 Tax=Bacillus sp. ISL-47 TaxID=2819130 RepID=UPI001BEA196C|nr:DUF3231 family protein [Bacillus sp. ISL-47]MBT2690184.1 DUF3231 family protein [Bacillus sp. ISL-47]MBT2710367.1 DUF3231 family protein [Pseudomonas sp. ISL-84]